MSTKKQREEQRRAEDAAEDAAPLTPEAASQWKIAYDAKVKGVLERYVARRAKAGNPVRTPFPYDPNVTVPDMGSAPAPPEAEEEEARPVVLREEVNQELAPEQIEKPYEQSDMSFRAWRNAFLRGSRLTIPTLERMNERNEYSDSEPLRANPMRDWYNRR